MFKYGNINPSVFPLNFLAMLSLWIIIAISLGSCSGMSVLSPDASALRRTFALTSTPVELKHLPFDGSVKVVMSNSARHETVRFTFASRLLKNGNLLISGTDAGGHPITFMYNSKGHLEDFNIKVTSWGERITSDSDKDAGIAVIGMMFPEFTPGIKNVGDVAATWSYSDGRGRSTNTYYYSGITTHEGIQVALLDIRTSALDMVIGFALIDLQSGLLIYESIEGPATTITGKIVM